MVDKIVDLATFAALIGGGYWAYTQLVSDNAVSTGSTSKSGDTKDSGSKGGSTGGSSTGGSGGGGSTKPPAPGADPSHPSYPKIGLLQRTHCKRFHGTKLIKCGY